MSSSKELKESKESLVFLELGVLQGFLVEMDHQDLRVCRERKDFQVSLEERDQRVTQEIQVYPVPSTFKMEMMPEVLKVTVGIPDCLDPQVILGTWACLAHLAHQG